MLISSLCVCGLQGEGEAPPVWLATRPAMDFVIPSGRRLRPKDPVDGDGNEVKQFDVVHGLVCVVYVNTIHSKPHNVNTLIRLL